MSSENKTVVVTRPDSNDVLLVIGLVLEARGLDVQQLISAMVPAMARDGVQGGLLVVGDSTLVVKLTGKEATVDEVDTTSLLALADIEDGFSREDALEMMMRWVTVLRDNWDDRLVGPLRDLLVPNIVGGLDGEMIVSDGIWGSDAQPSH